MLYLYRKIASSFRIGAGKSSVEPNFSRSLVERNHHLDHLFSSIEVIMKMKPKKKKDEADSDDEDNDDLDDSGYKDIPTVGVSILLTPQLSSDQIRV